MVKKLLLVIDGVIMSALAWATSTKGAFYLLNFFVITAVILHPPTDIQGWLLVIVSEYYQGIALPGLGSSQKKDSEETRRLMQETHDNVMLELADFKELHADAVQQRADIKKTYAAEIKEIEELKEIIKLLKNGGINDAK